MIAAASLRTALLDTRTRLNHVRTPEIELALAILVSILVIGGLESSFFRYASLANLAVGAAFIGIIALGESILLLAGEFDLSVGAVAGLASVVGAKSMIATGGNIPIGVLAAVGTGLLVGAINAACVVLLRLPSFITTIGMQFIASGLATFITHGNPVYPLPAALTQFGLATPLNLSWMFFIFLGLGVLIDLGVRFTTNGRRLMASGGDPAVAAITGIRTGRVKAAAFLICSGIAALAGLLQMASQGVAQPTTGNGAELSAIAAAVIGGTSIFGGSGSPLGAMLGVLFLTIITVGVVVVGFGANWQSLAIGIILVIAIGADVARRRASTRRT
ncbi:MULTISPECIES: ABC transporter permease [unclassified Nonomuraea]|uniref:ABC transporter permease n=1 Tax=unclassified Nonomuraea TaxID=2593643 RepID=UPI003410B163